MKKGYLILIIPLFEEHPSNCLWLQLIKDHRDGEEYDDFDWTNEIRETIYYESEEEAQKIAMKHAEILQPNFCSVIELNQKNIDFLQISQGKTLEKLKLLEY